MNTQESNKIIAEFMGTPVKLFKEDKLIYRDYKGEHYASYDVELAIIDNKPHEAKDLQYHTSWDWLMPVVEKIENLGYNFIIDCIHVEIKDTVHATKEYNPFYFHSGKQKITCVFTACSEFIQWYNTHNKK